MKEITKEQIIQIRVQYISLGIVLAIVFFFVMKEVIPNIHWAILIFPSLCPLWGIAGWTEIRIKQGRV